MSERVSDERLADLKARENASILDEHARAIEAVNKANWARERVERHVSMLEDHIERLNSQLQQYRALVAELRALAERMRQKSNKLDSYGWRDPVLNGESLATDKWRAELSALLSAHTEDKP